MNRTIVAASVAGLLLAGCASGGASGDTAAVDVVGTDNEPSATAAPSVDATEAELAIAGAPDMPVGYRADGSLTEAVVKANREIAKASVEAASDYPYGEGYAEVEISQDAGPWGTLYVYRYYYYNGAEIAAMAEQESETHDLIGGLVEDTLFATMRREGLVGNLHVSYIYDYYANRVEGEETLSEASAGGPLDPVVFNFMMDGISGEVCDTPDMAGALDTGIGPRCP
ncbi:hypothetical protein [Demequina zhanjiangensis]|uniref:Lipoprotein n=1 Tax=Demequina zhanjiangensis TaxID=3051659 RepID=A0ABT8G431_9MICO|nr:hypothetical protein [Demequina sp. SYSU T00b26]MDN4473900.1 hypothetical protein [Demequina sp. SYSU T00b26]